MDLPLSKQTLGPVSAIDESFARLTVTANHIQSFDEELRAWNRTHAEGAHLINMVYMLAKDTGLDYEAVKRVLWVLVREMEAKHVELVKQRETAAEGCDDDLKLYLNCLEYVIAGNKAWSEITESYHTE